MVVDILNKLKGFEDPLFLFDPIKHKYTYNGKQFVSVTQFISRFHQPFDSDYWSRKKAEEQGKYQWEILHEWKELNDRSNIIGTGTHNWIENYYNRIYQELPSDADIIDRINKFNIAYVKYLYKLTPIIFEQRLFSKRFNIAGMLDSLFMYNQSVVMIDYKTNKDFTDDDHKNGKFEKLLYPFQDYKKNHHNEYSIQLSLYKLILREVGIEVKVCYLLHIGPNTEAKMYKSHDFTEIIEKYLLENPI
jgi:ATP-dependent exoDNAse (exonuclease V) beta subunit